MPPAAGEPLTVGGRRLYSGRMTSKRVNAAAALDLELLAVQIEELLGLCERLRQENERLRAQQSQMEKSQAQLAENNEFSRRKIEAMISRLKVLETEL